MDLVLIKGLKPIACIELKTTNASGLTRGYYESVRDLKCSNNFLVTPDQPASYKSDEITTVCGIHDFLIIHLPKIIKWKLLKNNN